MKENDSWKVFYEAVQESHKIIFFGGAGVSTESGIPDFRSAQGLYKKMPEEILSHDFFFSKPEIFYQFYKEYLLFPDIEPNVTHSKLAEWEKEGKLLSVVTQNIDGLHQMAGSQRVWELHGSVQRNYCVRCHRFYLLEELLHLMKQEKVPLCTCGGIVKPDVVLYGESLDSEVVQGAISDLQKADTCIVGGTSLSVYPAAGFLREFSSSGKLFIINREVLSTSLNLGKAFFFQGSLGEFFSQLP